MTAPGFAGGFLFYADIYLPVAKISLPNTLFC
jgi:hypothetical protein